MNDTILRAQSRMAKTREQLDNIGRTPIGRTPFDTKLDQGTLDECETVPAAPSRSQNA